MVEKALNFVNEILSEIDRLKRQEPFPINLLEEVHLHDDGEDEYASNMKENSHSRILRSLLSFRYEDNYVLLNSLIQHIVEISGASSQWKDISIKSPEKPVNEMGRIDLLVHEKGKYALIFENKINNAGDQPNQIARYIDFIKKDFGYRNDQIFIIYLSSEGDDPTDQTWKNDTVDYKIPFKDRYVNLSYKKDILPWLRKASQCIQKMPQENLLTSALIQYINYLEIKYMQRPVDVATKKMISDRLGLEELNSEGKKLIAITKQTDSILEILKYLEEFTIDSLKRIYGNRYSKLQLMEPDEYKEFVKDTTIDIAFRFNTSGGYFYAALYRVSDKRYCGIFAPAKGAISSLIRDSFSWLKQGHRRRYCELVNYEDKRITHIFETANKIAII